MNMGSARWRAPLTGVLAGVAILRMAWVIGAAGASFDRRYYCGERQDRNVEAGHSLLHGLIHENIFRSMPAGTTANALMCRESRPGTLLAAPTAAFLLSGAMVFALGQLLAGGMAGALALALFSMISDPGQVYNDRWLFTLSLLLVAFLAVWRARFPSTRKTALLAAAIGFSLNILSALFLLPAVLAAWDWRAHRGRPRPERLRHAALLLLVPYLFLLPWTFATWKTTRRPALLEAGRSDANVIAGALGLVQTVGPGSARDLAGITRDESVLAWAAGEAARHPLRFLSAFARRLYYAASLQPLLLTAALLALWLLRRRAGAAQLGVVLLYFLAVHCLMAVEERYFTPLWPLAAALAAGLAGFKQKEPARLPWSGWLAACAFLPLAVLVVYAQGLVLAYPSRSADPDAWSRELSRKPDAWLLGAQGRRLLREGRPDEAVSALTRSLEIAPQTEQEQMLSWALIMRDGRAGALFERLSRELEPEMRTRQILMHALAHLRGGRMNAAAEDLSRAEALQSSRSASWAARAPAAARDDLGATLRELLAYWPIPERLAILEGLAKLPGRAPLRTAAEEAAEALKQAAKIGAGSEEAFRLLDYAERLAGKDAGVVRRVAEEYLRLKSPDRAVEALIRLAARTPRDLGLRFDLALMANAAGRREARKLCVTADDSRRLADAYREIGEPRQAAALLKTLTAGRASPNDLADLARLHMGMKEYDKSLTLLDELVRREPGNARWRNDRGVVLILLGRKEEAVAELRLSLEKDPGMLSAALSLGTLLSSTGRGAEASAVYDRALAQGGTGDPATREKIVIERARAQ
jgi:tetratricopeptide (TPR) repeat protein